MLFITINSVLLNVAEIQSARAAHGRELEDSCSGDNIATTVWFTHGGWVTIPDITVEQLQLTLDGALRSLAPF